MMAVNFLPFLLAPLTGAIIGYTTNALAIKMLFWPYQPLYITLFSKRFHIPFTPGLFPQEQCRLADKVADIITQRLLTPYDIKTLTISLITPENIETSVDSILRSVIKEFSDVKKLRRFTAELSHAVAKFLKNNIPELLESSLKNNKETREFLEKTFERLFLSAKISSDGAQRFSHTLFQHFLTPNNIRKWLIYTLTDENIAEINKIIQSKTTGGYYLLAKIVTPKTVLNSVREALKIDPLGSNQNIADIIDKLNLEYKFAEILTKLDLKLFPYSTIDLLKNYILNFTIDYIVDHSKTFSEKLSADDVSAYLMEKFMNIDITSVKENTLAIVRDETTIFILTYLEKELGHLLEQAIPAVGIHTVIAKKIANFSPKELEKIIYSIAHRELAGIEILGGVLGGIIGLFQGWLSLVL